MILIGLDGGNMYAFASAMGKDNVTVDLTDKIYPYGYPTSFAYKGGEEFFGNQALSERYAEYRKDLLKKGIQNYDETFTLDGKKFKSSEAFKKVIKRVLDNALRIAEPIFHDDDIHICLAYPVSFDHENIMYYKDIIEDVTLSNGKHPVVDRVISEPEAAVLDYFHKHGEKKVDEETVICSDLGGGTYDVCSVTAYPGGRMTKDKRRYNSITRHQDGDSEIGGMEYTKRLADVVTGKLEAEFKIKLPSGNISREKIMQEAERIKIALTENDSIKIELPLNGEYPESSVTRKEFEDATSDLTKRIVAKIKGVYNRTNSEHKVSKIILVGGGNNMRIMKTSIEKEFAAAPNVKVVMHEPSLSISRGAARFAQPIHAGQRRRSDRMMPHDGNIVDLTENHIRTIGRSLAVKVAHINPFTKKKIDRMCIMVPRGSELPYNTKGKYKSFSTLYKTKIVNCSLYEAIKDDPDIKKTTDFKKILDFHFEFNNIVPAKTPNEIRVSVDSAGNVTEDVRDPANTDNTMTRKTKITYTNYNTDKAKNN